jgi:CheY-like chemotaxis protein
VRADPGLLEQVIVNLAVSGRDAMPGGGRLAIEVSAAEARDEGAGGEGDLPAGALVRLAVSDTGVGMDAATAARAFEPFFTTKSAGGGTGLGLSTVYGIVVQSGGAVRVSSAPGRGTNFRVYLPRCDQPVEGAPPRLGSAEPDEAPRGAETVLLVEDDESLRGLAERVLAEAGYRVLATEGPRTAVETADRLEGIIHLLLTDVILPDARGPDLARQIERRRPGLRVLFMSGYAAGHLDAERLGAPGRAFIAKPFTPGTCWPGAGSARRAEPPLTWWPALCKKGKGSAPCRAGALDRWSKRRVGKVTTSTFIPGEARPREYLASRVRSGHNGNLEADP